jgi:hypothetical protein
MDRLPERIEAEGVLLRRWLVGDAEAHQRAIVLPRRLGYRLVAEHPDEALAAADTGIDCTWRIERDERAAGCTQFINTIDIHHRK